MHTTPPPPCVAINPTSLVSSPRITSGVPDASRADRPGTSNTCACSNLTSTSAAAMAAGLAGQGRYGASIQPWRLPTMPHSSTCRSPSRSHGPTVSSSVAANPPAATRVMPLAEAAWSITCPAASKRYARRLLVPQSTAIMLAFPSCDAVRFV